MICLAYLLVGVWIVFDAPDSRSAAWPPDASLTFALSAALATMGLSLRGFRPDGQGPRALRIALFCLGLAVCSAAGGVMLVAVPLAVIALPALLTASMFVFQAFGHGVRPLWAVLVTAALSVGLVVGSLVLSVVILQLR